LRTERQARKIDRDSPMRIVLATIGTLGDLHPVLRLAIELRRQGHEVTVASSEAYRPLVETTLVSFRAIRPNLVPDPKRIRYLFDQRRGPERLIRDLMMPIAREMYADLLPLVQNADLLIGSELIYSAPAISERLEVPWLSLITAPVSFFSVYDPPVIPPAPFLHRLRYLGPWTHRFLNRLIRIATWDWSAPLRQLRRELGLPRSQNPLFEGKHSPYGSLAIFSPCFGRPQADWPPSAIQTGFIFYDGQLGCSDLLRRFLHSGEAPVVFTLGSGAVYAAGDFYRIAFEAARRLGRRAIFLLGDNAPPQTSSQDFYFASYLPFSLVFPGAVAVVHQGGVGTCAQALRAGCPSLVIPFGFDQLDNAYRMRRLGVARSLPRGRLGVKTLIQELRPLLADAEFKNKALAVSGEIALEDGVKHAVRVVESVLEKRAASTLIYRRKP
jgi:rhamnosyltransferase subunit B